jgi:mannose-6-phosphate isomerase-like protein (cupin superfamily)
MWKSTEESSLIPKSEHGSRISFVHLVNRRIDNKYIGDRSMLKKVSIETCFGLFKDTFSPKIVGELNGQHIKLVHCEGDKVPWHAHEKEDEMFLVVEGQLDVEERGGKVTLHAGEFTIVRRGVEHKVVPHGHVKLLLFEPAGIEHTGKAKSEITRAKYDRLDVLLRMESGNTLWRRFRV